MLVVFIRLKLFLVWLGFSFSFFFFFFVYPSVVGTALGPDYSGFALGRSHFGDKALPTKETPHAELIPETSWLMMEQYLHSTKQPLVVSSLLHQKKNLLKLLSLLNHFFLLLFSRQMGWVFSKNEGRWKSIYLVHSPRIREQILLVFCMGKKTCDNEIIMNMHRCKIKRYAKNRDTNQNQQL